MPTNEQDGLKNLASATVEIQQVPGVHTSGKLIMDIVARYTRISDPSAGGLLKDAETLLRERDAAYKLLGDCYRITGADPDGNEDWRWAQHATHEVHRLRCECDAVETELAAAKEKAERWDALLTADTLRFPCSLPLSDGGWHAKMSGKWGTCGIFADDLTELTDRIILHNIEVGHSRSPSPQPTKEQTDDKG